MAIIELLWSSHLFLKSYILHQHRVASILHHSVLVLCIRGAFLHRWLDGVLAYPRLIFRIKSKLAVIDMMGRDSSFRTGLPVSIRSLCPSPRSWWQIVLLICEYSHRILIWSLILDSVSVLTWFSCTSQCHWRWNRRGLPTAVLFIKFHFTNFKLLF